MAERLGIPIKDVLAPRDNAATLARLRGGVDQRINGRRGRRARAFVLAFAAIVILALGFVAGRTIGAPGRRPVAALPTVVAPASRSAEASIPLLGLETQDGTASQLLADGTTLELSPRTTLRLREARADALAFSLERGEARFVVAKRADRAFSVEAGPVRVLVRGTSFRVARTSGGATVSVEEGRVEVTTPDGARTLEAGERLSFPKAASEAVDASAPESPRAAKTAWEPLAAKGDYRAAYAALGSGGVGREAASAVDAATLFSLADVARLSGHPGEAIAPLERILADYPADFRASLAAFTLGKIELENVGRPASAARHFEESLRLGAPPAISEDATARRVEAYARAGELAKARASAAEYRAKFPSGRHEAEVTRWAAGVP